ncbi:MAG TPA: hypothetical protein ENI60_00780 [Candidatus Fraserbacteria bacterium]|nr:hypothetical protein [Candidatus Fraserbacteria bacterium]
MKKYALLHGAWPACSDLTLSLDQAYIARRGGKIYKLITLGHEAGLGKKNSMGFGMVEVVLAQQGGRANGKR